MKALDVIIVYIFHALETLNNIFCSPVLIRQAIWQAGREVY